MFIGHLTERSYKGMYHWRSVLKKIRTGNSRVCEIIGKVVKIQIEQRPLKNLWELRRRRFYTIIIIIMLTKTETTKGNTTELKFYQHYLISMLSF